MTRIRKAAKAAMVNQAFAWTSLILSLFTVPLYLSWLGPERYGLLLTGVAFSSFLMFSDAGVNWASILLIAQASGREDKWGIASIVRTSFPLALGSSLLVVIVVTGGWFALRDTETFAFLPQHPEVPGLLVSIGASVVSMLVLSPFYNLLTGLQEVSLSGIYQGTGRIIGVFASIAIASTEASLGWIYSGGVIGSVLAGIAAAIHAAKRHPWAFTAGPFWDRAAMRQQLRTGLKSLVMQSGMVLWGTAAVFAISFGAGPQFVPAFSVPMTILNAPLGFLTSFSSSLQPAYGEAIGRGEKRWIAETVGRILRRSLLLLGILASGFILLADPFIQWWTGGELQPPPGMLWSVLAIGSVTTILGALRFALTGINRHRTAALADLLAGLLALGFGTLVVIRLGPNWVGLAVAGAALLTSGWILPRELIRALDGERPRVGARFWFRVVSVTALTLLTGWLYLNLFQTLNGPFPIMTAIVIIIGVFTLLATWMLREEFSSLRLMVISVIREADFFPLKC
jgi:O-antigen/teichoic acid export membrane protein